MTDKMLKFVKIGQQTPPKREVENRKEDFNEIYDDFIKQKAQEQSSRCSQCGVPFCQVHCPLSNNIPDWLKLTAEGRLKEAYELSQSTNNMPEVCGRICPQDRLCEGNCVIEQSGHGTVTIGSVEKYITDNAWEQGWVKPIEVEYEKNQSVGIIGAGPAGLAAAEQLRKNGYKITVYDRYDRAGGLLIYGIPNFKLEKHIVERRTKLLKDGGIEFEHNFEVGKDATLEQLRKKHDAILIATGVYKPREINLPGNDLENIFPAMEFLTASNKKGLGDKVELFDKGILNAEGKDIVVIGGGDTAMDCVRTSVRQKGGAAIVMGSLSPKTRNAQVELYQSGDVDFLVATDAIGMGINMDLDNIFFSNLKKFDGKKLRRLNLSEIGQIAGRAGRYLNDGNFGITGQCKEMNAEEVDLIENHKFEEIQYLFWRNSKLNFNNPSTLIKSLDEKPHKNWLRKIYEREDEKALKFFLRDKNLKNIEFDSKKLLLLWECCQIPDFVKKSYGNHYEVVSNVFKYLSSKKGKVSDEYMRLQLIKLDKLEGNVDSLSNRIANVRTWSYVSNKNNWVENQNYWIEKTKLLEDKLSDRLHEELTKTFIDKRASVLARGLKQDMEFNTKILENNEVIIDNQFIGKINGLKLELDLKKGALETDVKSLKKAARQSVTPELEKRIQIIIDTGQIDLRDDFKIYWKNSAIAKLNSGKDYLTPNFDLIVDDMLEQNQKQKLILFIERWIKIKINTVLKSLVELKDLKEKNSSIKALAYQLYENNGVLKRDQVSDYLKNLGQNERQILRNLGVKFGRYHIFLYGLIKPEAVLLRTLLWKNYHQKYFNLKPPIFGLNFLDDTNLKNKDFMLLCGFEKYDETFFIYMPKKIIKKNFNKKTSKENPFGVLKNLNLN